MRRSATSTRIWKIGRAAKRWRRPSSIRSSSGASRGRSPCRRSEERRVGKECRSRGSPGHFQAEDGIRDLYVTGVQTCALPISHLHRTRSLQDEEGAIDHIRDDEEVSDVYKDLENRARRKKMAETLEHQIFLRGVPRTISMSKIGRASCRERV